MALASQVNLWSALAERCNVLSHVDTQLRTASPSLVTLYDGLTAFNFLNRAEQIAADEAYLRSAEALLNISARALIAPILSELAGTYGTTTADPSEAVVAIRDGMIEDSDSVASRAWTRDTFSAFVRAGSTPALGTCYRTTIDDNGERIESGFPQKVLVRCTEDAWNDTAKLGNEPFVLEGESATYQARSGLRLGDALPITRALRAYTSEEALLRNGSFETGSGAGASTTSVSGWTSLDTSGAETTAWNSANVQLSAALAAGVAGPFRNQRGLASGKFLTLAGAANVGVVQRFSVSRIRYDRSRPMYLIARINPRIGATPLTGTVRIRLGTQTAAKAFAAPGSGAWEDLVLAVDANDVWPSVWAEEDPRVVIDLSAHTSGSVAIDEVLLFQPALYDGVYYGITAGVDDYLRGDVGDYTDTVLDTGEIQYWIARLTGRYLSHLGAGSETISDA